MAAVVVVLEREGVRAAASSGLLHAFRTSPQENNMLFKR